MAKKLKGAAALRAAAVFPLLACVTLPGASAFAQTPARAMETAPRAVRALLVSDIHFEPFWDPAKAAQLNATPASEWKAILAAPDSADRAQRFSELAESCRERGVDTPRGWGTRENNLQTRRGLVFPGPQMRGTGGTHNLKEQPQILRLPPLRCGRSG